MPYYLQENHQSRHLVDKRNKSPFPTPTFGKKPMVAKSILDVRYDSKLTILDVRYNGTHHWLDFEEKRNCCLRFNVRYLRLKNVENVKCTYDSNFIFKNIRFH